MEVANNMARRHPFILNARVSPARWAVNAVKGRLPAYDWEVVLRDLQQDCGCAALEIAVSKPTRSGRRQAKVLLEEASEKDPIEEFEKLLQEEYPHLVDGGGTGGTEPGGSAGRDAPEDASESSPVGSTIHRPKLLSRPSLPSGSGAGREAGESRAPAAALDRDRDVRAVEQSKGNQEGVGTRQGDTTASAGLGGRAQSGAGVGGGSSKSPAVRPAPLGKPEAAPAPREAAQEGAGTRVTTAEEAERRGEAAGQDSPVPSVLLDGTRRSRSSVEDRAPSASAAERAWAELAALAPPSPTKPASPAASRGPAPQVSVPRGVRADVLTRLDPWLSVEGGKGEKKRTGPGAKALTPPAAPSLPPSGAAGPDWDWTGGEIPEGEAGTRAGEPETPPRLYRLSPRERQVEARVQLAVRKAREARERMRLWPRRTTRIYSVQGRGQGASDPKGPPPPDDRT